MKLEKCKKKKKGKKGQVNIGVLIIAFVGIIVGMALFLSVAQTVGQTTSTVTLANVSIGAAVVNGTSQYLTDYVNLDDVVIFNATGDVLISATNYTVTNHVVYNGAEVVQITPQTLPALKSNWKVSGTAEPQGYVGGAARSMALIIPIFFALVIAVIALTPSMNNKFMEMIGR